MSTTSLEGARILVVEDDYLIAEDMRHDLEAAGVVVIGPVPSVGKALRLLEGEPALDAAVLDVNLGDERSFPIADALVARKIPFLFATGYNSGDIPDAWKHAVAVAKPLRITAVAELLARRAPH